MDVTDKPGIGVEVKEKKLEKATVRKKSFSS